MNRLIILVVTLCAQSACGGTYISDDAAPSDEAATDASNGPEVAEETDAADAAEDATPDVCWPAMQVCPDAGTD